MIEDKINGRLYQNQFDYVAENLFNEVGDNLTTKVGKPIYVYKFRKTSGSIKLTNLGERSLEYDNNVFRQSTNVYTGKEPITVVWDNSTKLTLDNNDNIIKECKVGTYYELYFEETTNTSLTIDNLQILDKNYVNSYITKNLSLKSYDWEVNENDTLEYLYLILDKRNKSLQWLEITNYRNYYQEETRTFIESEITFETINLKYSQSGKTLIDFIQLGSLGEGYAFPLEEYDSNGKATIKLDEKLLLRENDGVIQLQYDFNNGVGNSDFLFWGRKKETLIENVNGEYRINVSKPQILLPRLANFPKSGTFFYNKPNLNSFVVLQAEPTKQEIWNSYKEAYKGNNRIGEYNVDKTKQVLTGFKCDTNSVRNSNPNWNTNLNWDNKNSINLNINDIDLSSIPYVKNTNQIVRQTTYCEFFTINAFLNWYTDVIKFDYRETTKWKLTDTLGILGSITNTLVGGLDIGWTNTINLAPSQPLNFLIPCISFEDGKAALSDQAPLPSDIFIDNNIKKVLPTSTNVLTSWNFSLTDLFIDETITNNAINEIGKGQYGIWNTKYLGQTHDENGNQLLQSGEPLLLNLNTFRAYQPSTTKGFIVDVDKHHTIGECDYKISGYNSNNETIYSLYTETNSKARNEITIWENLNKYNYYDKFNTVGQATWPIEVIPPKPTYNETTINVSSGLRFTPLSIPINLYDFDWANNSTGGSIETTFTTSHKQNFFLGTQARIDINRTFTFPQGLDYITIPSKQAINDYYTTDIVVKIPRTINIQEVKSIIFQFSKNENFSKIRIENPNNNLLKDIQLNGNGATYEFYDNELGILISYTGTTMLPNGNVIYGKKSVGKDLMSFFARYNYFGYIIKEINPGTNEITVSFKHNAWLYIQKKTNNNLSNNLSFSSTSQVIGQTPEETIKNIIENPGSGTRAKRQPTTFGFATNNNTTTINGVNIYTWNMEDYINDYVYNYKYGVMFNTPVIESIDITI